MQALVVALVNVVVDEGRELLPEALGRGHTATLYLRSLRNGKATNEVLAVVS